MARGAASAVPAFVVAITRALEQATQPKNVREAVISPAAANGRPPRRRRTRFADTLEKCNAFQ